MEFSKTVIFCTPNQYDTDVKKMLCLLGYAPEIGAMNPMQPIHVGVILFSDGHFSLCVEDWMKIATDYETLSFHEFMDEAMYALEKMSITFLRERGFGVTSLWSVQDVKQYCDITDYEAMEVLENVLDSERVMRFINEEIEDEAERFHKPTVEK